MRLVVEVGVIAWVEVDLGNLFVGAAPACFAAWTGTNECRGGVLSLCPWAVGGPMTRSATSKGLPRTYFRTLDRM